MERLGNTKPSGMNANGLRAWGMIFVVAGIISRSVLQNRFLGVGSITGAELVQVMQASQNAMYIATAALVLQAMETCAVPIFAFLLVEGFRKAESPKAYAIWVALVAVVSEIPYNLAMSQKVLDLSSRNPAVGLLLGLALLYLYRRFEGKKAICVIATIAGFAWAWMLGIDHGAAMVLMIATMWLLRKKPAVRSFVGAAVGVLCTIGSMFYLAAPMGFLAIHFYNGEEGADNQIVNMVFYPVVLLVIGLVAMFVLP